jgi:hypothetical protein
MAEWAGIVNTTITKYFRGETDEVLRNRILLAILNDRGLVTMNNTGKDVQWQPRFLQAPMIGFDDSDTLTFSRVNRHKDASLPWRGYAMPESMTERERLMNSGVEAIVKVFSNKAKWMMEDIEEQLGTELYVDGNATGNSKKFHGIESFGGYSGTVASSPVGSPHSVYGNLNTDLASYGGGWAGNWPQGTGSATYDFWSPTIVDYTNAFWPQATKTWPNTCIDALRYGIMATQKNKSKKKALDIILLERELYRQWVSLLQTEERLNVSPENGSSGAWKLGFKNMQNFDGVDVTWEYGTPSGVGYGLCMNDVELMSLQAELVVAKGPTFEESSQSWRFWATILANLKFEGIRNFLFLKAIS